MIKLLSLFIVVIFCSNLIFAQPAGNGKTYAIIIGIAQYQDPDIRQLQFANRDAAAFADYLMSASGGSVPKQQIRFLTDSAATIGEVDKALRWVLNNCKENDRVYFYFSGHGEMENFTMSKNGYLICYNTPSVAFVNMGLSIDYLNDVVNTLSVRSKAKVIVITDACHSGTVAGSKFKGNFFVGEQLMLKKQNEIRMASSKPDQLSNEKTDWGGGRGVFSYYLLNGLKGGLADTDNDKMVSVGELKNYLENKMANDPVLKNDGDIQTPVINGDAGFKMAKVVEAEAVKVKEQVKTDSVNIMMVISAMSPVNEDENSEPDTYFFSLLKKQHLEGLTDSLNLNLLPADKVAFALINQLKKSALSEIGKRKLTELETGLRNDKEMLNRFNLDIASTFLDIGQNVISNYIKGDEAEMERRRYYNNKKNDYDVYTRMFAVALKLSQADKYYSTKADVFLHYFTALALRLKIPLVEDQKPLIDSALQSLKKAMALEENAPYIYNELGNIYQYKKDHAEAEKNFIKASQFSPGWALPYSNLGSLYTGLGAYEKAIAACNTADSLEKYLHPVKVAMGYINEKKGNLLAAEEYYHNAIDINSRHFAPFERLGFVYMNTTDYARADSFFYEASVRKKGYHFKGNEWEIISGGRDKQQLSPMFCDYDTININPTDLFTFFIWGVDQYKYLNYDNAIRILKKVIALDNKNPLVFHYIGKIFFDQKKWEEAEVMFKLAKKYQLNLVDFNNYVDSVKRSEKYTYDNSCAVGFFMMSYYKKVEDYFFTGTLYEAWKHVEEAEINFKEAIKLDSLKLGGYLKLWKLYEKQGRFTEAEDVIKASIVVQSDSLVEMLDKNLPHDKKFVKKAGMTGKERCDRELNAFYHRTIEKFPEDGNWNYKLGLLLYNRAHLNTIIPYFDSIVWFPKLNKELFIDYDFAINLQGKILNANWEIIKIANIDSLALLDESTTGPSAPLSLDLIKVNESEGNAIKKLVIPGTGENIDLADPVILPRKNGITYLKRAAELLSDNETLADIHFKTGNIYLWAGSKKQAYPYFEKSLAMLPDNANARLKLVDIYAALYKNSSALKQLNYLYDSSQINFEKRMLLAEFNIHAGEFEKAVTLLNKAEIIYPYQLTEITDLRGRLNLLANKPRQAIIYYESSMKQVKGEMYKFPAYSLARLYASTGNNDQAFQWLKTAIGYGFNYSFVLQNDPQMDKLRLTQKWKTLVGGIAKKEYSKAINNTDGDGLNK